LLQQFVNSQVEHGLDLVSALAYAMTSAEKERVLLGEAATFWLVTVIFSVMEANRGKVHNYGRDKK